MPAVVNLARPNHTCGYPGGTLVKNPPANARDSRDAGSIPGSGRFPREGIGNPLQYSCLKNPMDRGAWKATVHSDHKELDMTEKQYTIIPEGVGQDRSGDSDYTLLTVF